VGNIGVDFGWEVESLLEGGTMERGDDMSRVEEVVGLESLHLIKDKSPRKNPRKETATTCLPLFKGKRWEVE